LNLVLDVLFLRRPKINYISPPVCEAIFSGTGSPIIILPEIGHHRGPTGLVLGGHGQVTLSWNNYPGALCYNVYSLVITPDQIVQSCDFIQQLAQHGTYLLLSECQQGTTITLPAAGCYRVSAITGDGESDLSNPVCTCACPSCSCPPGTDFYPSFGQCLCSAQSCGAGQVWDPIQCKCVNCGSQTCPPGFISDPAHPCNCINGGGSVISVCNKEQSASCPPPGTGTVTIPAGTFCIDVHNPTPASVAAAQNDMDTEAQAQAISELNCNGWKICNWPSVRALLSGFGQCSPSTFPAWDGVFNVEYGTFPFKVWYFIDQSIDGTKTAASEAPDYPPIQTAFSNDCFTQLEYGSFTGTWTLFISCADACGTTAIWSGTMTNNDPDNPAGIYTNDNTGVSAAPVTIEVCSNEGNCGPDWTTLSWAAPTFLNNATATFAGNGGNMSCTMTPGPGSNAAVRGAKGTLNYTGCASQSQINLNVTSWFGGGAPFLFTGFTIKQDGNVVLNYHYQTSSNPPVSPGSVVVPFTLVPGTNSLIEVTGFLAQNADYIGGSNDIGNAGIAMNFTITNTPPT
jgi:hypothetical protein